MKKKLCSILLALTMVLTLLPVSALADVGAPAEAQPEYVAQIGMVKYKTLAEAVAAVADGGTVTLLKNATGGAVGTYKTPIEKQIQAKSFTIDFGGYTYTVTNPAVGSTGYESQAFHLEWSGDGANNHKVTFQNGTIKTADEFNGSMLIQNYCDLTLDNMTIIGDSKIDYVASNNCGNVVIKDSTITAADGKYAFDVYGGFGSYSDVTVTVEGNSVINGKIEVARENNSANTNKNTLLIKGGTINGPLAVTENANTTVSISGGTFSDLSALDYLANGANVTIKLAADTTKDVIIPINGNVNLDLNGKTFTTVDCGLSVASGATLTVSDSGTGGKLTSSGTPIRVDGTGSKAIINNGTIESTNDYGIYAKNNGAIIVNGGTVTSKDAALSGNNTTGNMNFEVNGGTLTAAQGPAIYMPGQVNLTVTNGTLNGGISLRMGQVNISGGTINSISTGIDSPAKYYNYSGNAWLPDALYVFGGTYTSEDAQYGNSLNLNITGGTFNCLNDQGSAVAIYDIGKVAQTANVTISGGTFTANSTTRKAYQVLNLSDIGVTDPEAEYNNPDYVGKVNSSLTGGTYSADPSAYVAPGYVASYNGSTYTVYYPVPVTSNNNNNSSSTTTKNPDGSTTTTTTDKATGAVTETTTTANGSVGTVKTDANGSTEISASISAADVKAAEQKNAPVIAPITVAPAASSAAAPVIKLSVPANAGEVAVAIPVVNAKQGTVAIKVNPDGTEEIIKTAVITENGLVLGVKGSMQIKVINNSKNFADTVGHWAASDVDFVSARELFNGTAPALFSPEASMTRGMVVTVIARLAGENTDGGANWYDKGCAWAVANGVSDGTDPNGSITREQLAAMLYRYCGSPAASGSLSAYADAASVSAFGSDAMQWCVNNGIINGMDGLLNPQGQATRAQVSAMFARYIRLEAAK